MGATSFTPEILEVLYGKIDSGSEFSTIAEYNQCSTQAISNYNCARKLYLAGKEIPDAKVSKKVFCEWAKRYGGNGTPKFAPPKNPDRPHRKKTDQAQISVEDVCELEKNDIPLPPPLSDFDKEFPAYFIDRTDNVICHQIAEVAINAINALLDIHKRRCDHGDSCSDSGVQRVG